ncbi:DUF4832 domain-containing protein, partial [Paenibacillus arenilitoris]
MNKVKFISKVSAMLAIFLLILQIYPCVMIYADEVSETGTPQEESITQSVYFKGYPEEWDSITYNNASTIGNKLEYLKVTQNDNYLYLYISGTDITSNYAFYLDSDDDPLTGTNISNWRNSTGIDFKIFNGMLYKFSDGSWISEGMVVLDQTNNFIEVAIPKHKIISMQSNRINVSFVMDNNFYLPNHGLDMVNVDIEKEQKIISDFPIIIDGTANDWSNIVPIAKSDNDQSYMSAFINNDNLNVLYKGELSVNNEFLIDTDNSPESGLVSAKWPLFGADVLIRDGSIYRWHAGDWIDTLSQLSYIQSGSGSNGVIEFSVSIGELMSSSHSAIRLVYSSDSISLPGESKFPARVYSVLPHINVDGSYSDWSILEPIAYGNSVVQSVYAFSKNQILFIHGVGSDFSQETNIYINSDNNSNTGYQNGYYNASGADYLIQDSRVYRSTGSDWGWERIGNASRIVSNFDNNQLFELSVDISGWDVNGDIKLSIGVEENYAPVDGIDFKYINYQSEIPNISIDGEDLDWQNIRPLVEVDQYSTELFAVQDQNRLYTLIKGQDLDTRNLYYIDSDNNPETGYQSSLWIDAGADYKVEYNNLYQYVEEGSTWIKKSPIMIELDKKYIMMQIYLEDINRTIPGELKIGYVGKESSHIPSIGLNMLNVDTSIHNIELEDTFYPKESFQLLENPFIGWSPWANRTDYEQPFTLVYANFNWRDIEPSKGEYNWSELETRNNFDYWTNLGKKINLRIVLDKPSDDPQHMDIPDWLYDELVAAEGASGAGIWYNTPGRAGFSPNYSSEVLIEEHKRLIQAFANRYNNDPRVSYIQIGSLGHWGEFHNYPEEAAGKFPNVNVSDQYVQHYVTYITNKKLAMRKPFPIAAQNGIGLFNDAFGDSQSSEKWLNWANTGWDGITDYVAEEEAANAILQSRMPDYWKTSFSAGEFAKGESIPYFENEKVMDTMTLIKKSHTSWLGPASPASYNRSDDGVQANIDLIQKKMGYRLLLRSINHVSEVEVGETIQLSSVWENKGVAPFYYDWPVAVAVADPNGNLIESSITISNGIDVREWLPGEIEESMELLVPTGIPKGNYSILTAILDPNENKPGVELAIEGKRLDGWYELDQIFVNNDADTIPTKPSLLRETNSTTSTIELSWNPSFDDGSITGYEIYQGDELLGTTSEPMYRINNLLPDTSYTFMIRSIDSTGNYSEGIYGTFSTSKSNLLKNSGFETYTGSNGAADEWTPNVTSG